MALGTKGFGFNMKALLHHYSLQPIVVITGAACVMCASYVAYMCIDKPDVAFNKWAVAPYTKVKPDQYHKLMRVNQKLTSNPEIEALRRELGSAA